MKRGTFSLQDAMDIFLLDCEARRLTVSTRDFYRGKLSTFLTWCEGEGIDQLDNLSAHDIRRFLVHIQRR